MRILIAGAGVIGTVYGAHLGAAGHAVLGNSPATSRLSELLLVSPLLRHEIIRTDSS